MQDNLFLVFVRPLNELSIPYMVTGSVATILYGEPRLTHDIDLVIELSKDKVSEFGRAFPSDRFYFPPEEVVTAESARRTRGHFNIIHHESGFKADVYLKGEDALHIWAMTARRRIDLEGDHIWLAPPEYVIVRKLQYFREGGSEKHLQDIRGMADMMADSLDQPLLQRLIAEHGLRDEWNRLADM